jgi:diacylglycerol O-acyltransferase / wax synthase
LVGRLMSYRLDPDRPLWEAWVVEGLDGDRWALVLKVHHSIADGLGGMALFGQLLDGAPAGSTRSAPRAAAHRPLVGRLAAAVRAPARTASVASGLARAIDRTLRYANGLRPTSASSLNGALGTSRRYRTCSVELADVAAVRAAYGGTVNDVVLAMVTHGFRGLLIARGEPPVRDAVRCLVPVSMRTAEQAREGANRIGVLLTELPVQYRETSVAYKLLRTRLTALKTSGEARVGANGFALADLLPPPFVAAALALLRRVPQRVVTTIATNVPGPRSQQTLLDRRMVALYPYVPIADRIRIAVAVTSYVDHLHFGVTCDRTSVPDADAFVAAMQEGLADLVKSAASTVE